MSYHYVSRVTVERKDRLSLRDLQEQIVAEADFLF